MNVKKTYEKYKQYIKDTAKAMYDTRMRMRKAIEDKNIVEYKNMIAVATELNVFMRTMSEDLPPMDVIQLQGILNLKEFNQEIKDLCCQIYSDFGDRITIVQLLVVAFSMEHDRFWLREDMPDIKADVMAYKQTPDNAEVH